MATATKKKPVKKGAVKKPSPKPSIVSPLLEAIRMKSPMEIIEKLILHEEHQKNETARLAYVQAFREMQNVLPDLPKVKEAVDKNGKSYKYCPLPIMKEILQPFLYKFGFSYRWDFKPVGKDQLECTFIITHSQGHRETASMTTDIDDSETMNNIQSVGSTRTYLQRYTMIAGIGLAMAEEDNDGGTIATKTMAAISGPQAISNDRLVLENLDLEELMLKVDKVAIEDWIKEKYGDKTYFPEKEKVDIKRHIIDLILSNKKG